MKVFSRLAAGVVAAAALLSGVSAAMAGMGEPSPWQIGLQDSATPIMSDITWFHNVLLWIIAGISAFVLALLLIIIVRFNASANPTPTRTTHNTFLSRSRI
jgi:cytochrome c oxidase subunit 2